MPTILERQPLIIALAVMAVALVAVIGIETDFGTRLGPRIPTAAPKPAAPAEAKLLPPIVAGQPEQLYPETTARPLFISSRRPAPAQQAAAQQTFQRGQFVLQGVTIAGDNQIALLKEKSSGRIHRVERGRDVNGIKVAEITPESVTLAVGDEREVLPLQVIKPGPAAAAAPAAGPFGAPGSTASSAPHAPAAPGMPMPAPAVHAPGTANPSAPSVPHATTAPMSAQELLARRARRVQPNQ